MSILQLLKDKTRKLLINLKIDLTKNLEYDRLTDDILKSVLKPGSNAIDVGCHKGEILDLFIKYAPQGTHAAFEPLPAFYQDLVTKYKNNKNVSLYNLALSKSSGETDFTFVKSNPAYSGLQEREYDNEKEVLEIIKVQMALLDDIIAEDQRIDLIKIDVEGAEYRVLEGGIKTIKRCMPLIIFEHGRGASDYYGILPKEMYELLHLEYGYQIYTLKGFMAQKPPLTFEEFNNKFFRMQEYYFVASK
ncbi:MAG: FkbM family methyltransferase [Bacteroidetes bacterium]|nr:FkbM family methyltransferase [Bacteroidota bacterium]